MAIEKTISYTVNLPESLDFAISAARAAKAAGIGQPGGQQQFGYTNEMYVNDFVLAHAQFVGQRVMLRAAEVAGVPQSVTAAQAINALIDAGLKDIVEGAINTLTEPAKSKTLAWYQRSSEFHRTHPILLGMQAKLGWSDLQLDNLFKAAALL